MHQLKEIYELQRYDVFAFSRTALLISMRAGHIMSNPSATEVGVEFFILPSPVTLDCNDLPVKLSFNKFLKFLKNRENFRFEFVHIYLP